MYKISLSLSLTHTLYRVEPKRVLFQKQPQPIRIREVCVLESPEVLEQSRVARAVAGKKNETPVCVCVGRWVNAWCKQINTYTHMHIYIVARKEERSAESTHTHTYTYLLIMVSKSTSITRRMVSAATRCVAACKTPACVCVCGGGGGWGGGYMSVWERVCVRCVGNACV
jgi:hypothetical protein